MRIRFLYKNKKGFTVLFNKTSLFYFLELCHKLLSERYKFAMESILANLCLSWDRPLTAGDPVFSHLDVARMRDLGLESLPPVEPELASHLTAAISLPAEPAFAGPSPSPTSGGARGGYRGDNTRKRGS